MTSFVLNLTQTQFLSFKWKRPQYFRTIKIEDNLNILAQLKWKTTSIFSHNSNGRQPQYSRKIQMEDDLNILAQLKKNQINLNWL